MTKKQTSQATIPLRLFRDLIWLQAVYAEQLNGYDQGWRKAVFLPLKLRKLLTDRERNARNATGIALPRRGPRRKQSSGEVN